MERWGPGAGPRNIGNPVWGLDRPGWAAMTNTVTQVNRETRLLLRALREQAGFSQRDAARTAGISLSWWKKIESGNRTVVSPGTLSMMILALGGTAEQAQAAGLDQVSSLIRYRAAVGIPHPSNDAIERYIVAIPGLAPDERASLIHCWRSLARQRRAA